MREDYPRVSVVIPCYNLGAYLREAVDSIRTQSLQALEIIVVDDGSTEAATLDVLQELEQEGIRVLHTPNRGLAAARNYGICQACGEFILPLDADDRIAPGYLEAATQELERHPQVGIVYGLVEFIGERSGIWSQAEFSVPRLLYENMIVASAVYRRADWSRVGGYSETMRHGWEDWNFWISLVEYGCQVVKLPEVVFFYRIRKDSMTRKLTGRQKLQMLLRLIQNHPRLYAANCVPFLLGLTAHVAGIRR